MNDRGGFVFYPTLRSFATLQDDKANAWLGKTE